MIKKIISSALTVGILTTGVQAVDKQFSYDMINQCKYSVDETGKFDSFFGGLLLGLAQGYLNVLSMSGIDNDNAGLNAGEYRKKMCQITLELRKEENKKTGGKYDVTKFYDDLQRVGYYMTLPATQDTESSN